MRETVRPVGREGLFVGDLIFAGFRLAGREPLAVGVWMVAVLLLGPWIAVTVTAAGSAPSQTTTSTGFAAFDAPALIALAPEALSLIVLCGVLNAAVLRAMTRPEARAFCFLRLGADELRQVLLLLYALVVAACVWGVVAAGVWFAMGQGGHDVARELGVWPHARVLTLLVASLFAITLSPAAAMTFRDKRIRLFAAWRVSKGFFWSLFSAFVLVALMLGLVSLFTAPISQAINAALGADGFQPQSPGERFSSLRAFLQPAQLVQRLPMTPFITLWLVSAAAIPATVYAHATAARDTPSARDTSHAFGSAPQA
jgi:hypothetical protein